MSGEPEVVKGDVQETNTVEEQSPAAEEQAVAPESLQPDDLAAQGGEEAVDGPPEGVEADVAEEKPAAAAVEEPAAEAEEEAIAQVELEEAEQEAGAEEVVAEAEEEPVEQIELEEAEQESVVEEAVAEAEEEPVEQEGRYWYVIHSYSGYENKVKQNLGSRIETMGMEDHIFEVVVPTEEVVELRDGRRRTVEQRIFPGYILVDMILNDESWFVVRNTPGVTGFVGSGNQPTPLRQEEADKILSRMEEEAPKVKVSFRIGDAVRIIDGPFTDFLGTVDDLNLERGKVRLLVSFFGRETPVELDFLQVETV
jgi:transcriptional antiterminator NusG